MPKERINPSNHGSSDNPSPHVEVVWGRDTFAQVAVCYDDRPVVEPEVVGKNDPTGSGLTLTYAVPRGLWCDLDRAGINRLIRTLRKARDQAYGADA